MELKKWLTAVFVFAGFIFHLSSQQNDQEVREFVNVINVIVQVRVQDKGSPVSGLKKKDFILTENKRTVEINWFREIRRSIATRQVELATHIQGKREPRFFLLYFWLANSNVEYKKTIDYFFDNIFQEGDRVVIATSRAAVAIDKKDEIAEKVTGFCESMDHWIVQQETEYTYLLRRLEQRAEQYKEFLRMPPEIRPKNYQSAFQAELESSWKEFKFKHLRSNVSQTLQLAEALKAIKAEKWALVFFQPLQYPMLRIDNDLITSTDETSDINFLNKLGDVLIREIMTPEANFPQIKNIQQAFIAANATFHVLQPPSAEAKKFNSPFYKTTLIYSGWEQTFKQISKATGGMLASGGQLQEILANVVEREDVYYELAYTPRELKEEKRSIKVSLPNRKFTVFHVRKTEVQELDLIKIDQMTFIQPLLKFRVRNFQRIYEFEKMQGHLAITVTAIDNESKNINYTKALALEEPESIISFKLNFPHPGKYRIVVEIVDKITGRQAVQSQNIEVLLQKE